MAISIVRLSRKLPIKRQNFRVFAISKSQKTEYNMYQSISGGEIYE